MTNIINPITTNESILKTLRSLMPARVLSYNEALQRAELQASRLLSLHQITAPAVPLEVVTEQPRIRIVQSYDLPVSGSAHWDGKYWVVTLNAAEYDLRQRFSALHEYKHIVDHPTRHLIQGDPRSKLSAEGMGQERLLLGDTIDREVGWQVPGLTQGHELPPQPARPDRVSRSMRNQHRANLPVSHYSRCCVIAARLLPNDVHITSFNFDSDRSVYMTAPPTDRADRVGSPDDMPTARLARAVIYLRVSTKEQAERGGGAEGFSIPAQREACLRKAGSLAAEVVDEFIDAGESAKTAQRPELQRLLRFLLDGSIQYVIVHKVDRLARNRVDDVEINVAIRKTGATLVSCTENIDETPSGALMHGIMSSIAEFYSKNLANEVIKGSVQKAKSGGTVGKAPTGYLNVRKWENGREVRTVEIDPLRGPLMKWVFEEYATGEWSLRTLLREVTKRGLTTTATARMPSKPLVLSHFLRLLRHPYYKGVVRYRDVEYPGSHEPLIAVETWNRVQQTLSAANTAGDKHQQHYHYLKGSVFCGECGQRLIISLAKNRHGTVYPYFICVGRQKKRSTCTQKAVLIDHVEALVEDHYATVQPTKELAERIETVLLDEILIRRSESEQERRVQSQRLRRLTDERQRLLGAYYDDAIPKDLLKSEQARITADMEAAQARLDALGAEYDVVQANLRRAIEFASNWHLAYLAAPPKVRRQMNQAIFERINVHEDRRITSTLAEPFKTLLSHETRQVVAEWSGIHEVQPNTNNVDDQWAQLSVNWSDEVERELVGVRMTNPRTNEMVGGLRVNYLVGAEGLEPPTTSL
jgi:site-specific DNA recombinase